MSFDENALTKGEMRKLTALRKSLGVKIADAAFGEWFKRQHTTEIERRDKSADRVAELLYNEIIEGGIKLPRDGYRVRRGRGRVIVENCVS